MILTQVRVAFKVSSKLSWNRFQTESNSSRQVRTIRSTVSAYASCIIALGVYRREISTIKLGHVVYGFVLEIKYRLHNPELASAICPEGARNMRDLFRLRFSTSSLRVCPSAHTGCLGKPAVSIRTYLDQRRYGLRGLQCSEMRKRGPDRASSWWWQYKARRVAGLSQSVSGTYTFKVRVLEGKLVFDYIRPAVCRMHEDPPLVKSRG